MKNIIDLICSSILIMFSLSLVFFNFSELPFEVMAAEQIKYVDADGKTLKTAADCRRIDNNTIKLTSGWYYAEGNVAVNTRISVSSLTIYCQEKGTGKLQALGGSKQSGIGGSFVLGWKLSGNITVNGGIIEAERGYDAWLVDVADIGDAVGHNNILTYNGGTINGINYEKIPE